MLSSTHVHRPRELGPFQVVGVFAGMLVILHGLTLTSPLVVARSTSPLAILIWAGGWAMVALTVTLLSWWVARATGVGVRDGYGIVPRWARSHRRLVQTENDLDAALLGAGALSVYLIVHSIVLIAGPTASGWLPVVVFTKATIAVVAELVLLGVLATLLTTSRLTPRDFVLISAGSRVVIAEPHWPALLASAAGGAAIALLYLHSRRLTPIIVGHTAATVAVTLTGAWVCSLLV